MGEAVTELSDDQVFGKQREMSDAEVFGDPQPDALQSSVPEAFLDRVRAGQALARITMGAIKGAKEGAGQGTPTGFEDETLNHLIDMGVFHDPATGRGGPVQMVNEALMMPAAQLWQTITRATAGGIHGAGGAVEELSTEFGASQGTAQRNKNEVINMGNWAMIEGGMGRFTRPTATPGGVTDQTIGGLPKPEDFVNGAKVLSGQAASDGMPSLFAKFGETGRAEKNSSIEAPPGAQAPLDHVSTRPEPSGSSITRPTTPESTTEGPATIFGDLELGAIDGSSNKKVLQGSNDYKALLANAERNKPKLSDALGRVTEGIDGASVYGVRVKDEPGLVEKITTKGRAPSTISDYLGGRIVADTPEAMNAVLARFEGTGAVIEAENFVHSPKAGYRAYHLQVGLGDGTSAEIQVVPRPIADKMAEMHAIRQPFKRMAEASPEGMARFKEAMESSVKISDDAWASAKGWPDSKIRDLNNPVDTAQDNLKRMWSEDGIHPAEAVHDAQNDAFLKNEITAKQAEVKLDPEDELVLTETGGKPGSLGAAATDPADVPLSVQPASAPGRLAAAWQSASENLFDIGRDAQMMLTPMATGTRDSMAMAKDFANSMRRNRWDWSRIDKDIADKFTPEQRARMWNAADEESLSLRLEEPASMRAHQGLATLAPEERAMVEQLQTRSQNAWVRARDIGMVEGEGLPAYTPRMIINVASAGSKDTALALDGIGGNLRTKTGNLLKRKYMESQDTQAAAQAKYGDQAMLARDIRVLPLATSQLEDAIAGRTLINEIKAYGERTGTDTVSEGSIPRDSETKWFTLDHPSFKTWRPKFEDGAAVKDEAGNTIFEQVPLYIHGDFEGPLRAVLSQKSNAPYGALMALKGKTMSLIMNSPMIHNAVEWGRAFPAAPFKVGTFKVYFEGNRVKNDVALMHEAIDNGLVPIGHRFFNQDITSVMESPDLAPGRSLTAKVLGLVPGLFDPAAEVAVRGAIDKAGDFWHNTLLWDRVGDLQMGLYKNFLDAGIEKGLDRQTSARVAAHMANRYAGALPKEAMSDGATKIANIALFSRSFTLGNLGVMKDMLTGLPKDVLAQIERDAGFGKGAISEFDAETLSSEAGGEKAGIDAVKFAKSMARRKAIATVAMDVGLLYVGNSVMQSALNVMLGDPTLGQEGHGYVRRFKDYLEKGSQNPLSMLWPSNITALSSTAENEPGLENRLKVGHTKDGTAIYARNPVGKIGEEFTGWGTSPLDMLKKKEGTIARPLLQILSNDAGFGRKIYDPDAQTPAAMAGTVWAIAKHLAGSQLPEGQITALSDLVKGDGDKTVNELQLAGPLAGVTFRKGAPGGEAVGEMYHNKSAFEFRVQQAMPDIRKQILRGDQAGAQQKMTDLGLDASYSRWVLKTTLNPATRLGAKAMRDFYRTATPEQRDRMTRIQGAPQPQ
jgi:ppGpp synthetase/RelA/SpoT-type nucleotidyltranferase